VGAIHISGWRPYESGDLLDDDQLTDLNSGMFEQKIYFTILFIVS